jgi:hypothetical protein
MVKALGYSIDTFDPADPGRLCRGREQWIESYELEAPHDGERVVVPRMVISGSEFTDETARDAMRGLPYSGLTIGQAFRAIYATEPVFASCEDGHPGEVPADAVQREDYAAAGTGGALSTWCARWVMPCPEPEAIDQAVAGGADVLLVFNEAPKNAEIGEELRRALFLLQGFRTDGPPARRFQSAAIVAVLEHVKALGLVHLDKHAPSLGLYGEIPAGASQALGKAASAVGALPVPFAIPPMLARWDRALWELRLDWRQTDQGDFPVPPAREPAETWGGGRSEESEEQEWPVRNEE